MAQQNLLNDAEQAARDEAEAALHRELRRVARDRGVVWPTVHVQRVELFKGNITAQVWLNGRAACVINRTDIETAARDLWEQVADAGDK